MAAIRAALIATALVAGICSVHGVLHGSRSDIVAAPWMVQLEYTTDSEWDFGCAGAIVSNNQILTAAHCVSAWPKMPIKIRAGATDGQTGGQVIFPASIVMHPKYDARNKNTGYDIAIINLAENLDMSETIQAIALIPEAQMTREWSVLTSGGWDLDEKDSTLTIFKMSRLPQLVCDTFAHSSYLCTSLNSGAPCDNDIGSPAWLAAEGSNPAYLVGVLRAGSWCKMSDNVLYTNVNVADVRSWVNANLNTRIRA